MLNWTEEEQKSFMKSLYEHDKKLNEKWERERPLKKAEIWANMQIFIAEGIKVNSKKWWKFW